MGGSSGGGTQRTEPPKYQLPYLQDSLREAQGLYRSNDPRVAPQSAATTDALSGIGNMARAGNPINGAAGNLAQQTLSGGFLGSNPHLDAMFEKARLASQGGISSEYARMGRNVDASAPIRADQLNNLATSIYGGAYDAERNRMQQTLAMSPMLGQAQYSDLDRLLGVGQAQEGYTQRQLDAPGQALDDYIGRISGNMGTTIKTTQNGSGLAGAAGGALLGAQFGSIIPGIGTGIGALGGGLLGGLWG